MIGRVVCLTFALVVASAGGCGLFGRTKAQTIAPPQRMTTKLEVRSVTLEPGSQIELSGAPYKSVHDGKAESDAHWADLQPVIDELGLVWLGPGCHPFASVEELGWVPKLRYDVMREYMPTRGPMDGDMMTKTCTVQSSAHVS